MCGARQYADQDGWAARLDRSREVERLPDAEVPTLEAWPFLGEHQLADPQRFVETAHPLPDGRKLEAVADVLILVPGRAQPEHGPSVGDDVQGRHGLGQQRGVAVGDAAHHGAQLDAAGPGGEGR